MDRCYKNYTTHLKMRISFSMIALLSLQSHAIKSPIRIQQLNLAHKDRQTDGTTCGHRSLYVAAALTNLSKKYLSLNTENLHQELLALNYLETMRFCAKGAQLSSQNIEYFLQSHHLMLDNLFVLGSTRRSAIAQIIPQSVAQESDFDALLAKEHSLKTLALLLKNNQLQSPIHFLCNTGGHWVLFFVINQNAEITLYYTDPGNASLQSPALKKFISYICNHLELIAP